MTYRYPYFYPYQYTTPFQTSPPKPDENWVDPVEKNRTYLKNIKKDCIQEEFEGLKEENLYLLEVFVEEVELKNDIIEDKETKEIKNADLTVKVKILHLPFTDMSELDTEKTAMESSDGTQLTKLLETIYNVSGRHVSIVTETDEEQKVVGEESEYETEGEDDKEHKEWTEKQRKEVAERGREDSKAVKVEESPKDVTSVKVMKGKSVLFTMTGLAMIQSLQGHPVVVKATRNDVKLEEEIIEGAVLASCTVRVPDNFPLAVLRSSKPDTLLPYLAVENNEYKLLDTQDQEVGSVHLTIVLSSFGSIIVNSIRQTDEDEYEFEDTMLMRSLENPPSDVLAVNPEFAKKVLEMGLVKIKSETSTEILKSCFAKNLVKIDSQTKKLVLDSNSCEWFEMVKKSQGKTIYQSQEKQYEKDVEKISWDESKDEKEKPKDDKCKQKYGKDKRKSVNERLKRNKDNSKNEMGKHKYYKDKQRNEKNKERDTLKLDGRLSKKLSHKEYRENTPNVQNFAEKLHRLNKNRLNTVSEILRYCFSKNYIKTDPNIREEPESLPEFNWFSEMDRPNTPEEKKLNYKETDEWAEVVKLTTVMAPSDRNLEKKVGSVSSDITSETIKTSFLKPKVSTSPKILKSLMHEVPTTTEQETIKLALRPDVCKCLIRLEKARPKSLQLSDMLQNTEDKRQEDLAVLWMKHKQVCRDLKREGENINKNRPSIYDRLEELRIETPDDNSNAAENVLEEAESPKTEDRRKSVLSTSSKQSKGKCSVKSKTRSS